MSITARTAKTMLGVFVTSAVVLGLIYVYLFLGSLGLVWNPNTCTSSVFGKVSGLSGHDFVARQSVCSSMTDGSVEISVFVAKSRWGRKVLVFKYERTFDDNSDAEPTIIAIDEHTVRISVKRVARIICRTPRWQGLDIEYAVGLPIDARDGPPAECAQR